MLFCLLAVRPSGDTQGLCNAPILDWGWGARRCWARDGGRLERCSLSIRGDSSCPGWLASAARRRMSGLVLEKRQQVCEPGLEPEVALRRPLRQARSGIDDPWR